MFFLLIYGFIVKSDIFLPIKPNENYSDLLKVYTQ